MNVKEILRHLTSFEFDLSLKDINNFCNPPLEFTDLDTWRPLRNGCLRTLVPA